MVGIGIDHISVARRLPIDAEQLARVVARLRLDAATPTVRWSLGDRGTCEVDTAFAPFAHEGGLGFTTTALLWDPEQCGFASLDVTLVPCDPRESQLELHPSEAIGDWWTSRIPAYLDLAHAALEELAQELLWQQSRLADEG
ncbi:MAG: hypothetical protein JWL83_151 [Actinomycetia bacterium]|jgi:hypothetical protein|nr:hypothetical protein [Actinomycetes bacterium]